MPDYLLVRVRVNTGVLNMCILAEWGEITRPMFTHQPYMIPVIYAYLMLVNFGLLNLIFGVIVEKTMDAGRQFQVAKEEKGKRDQMCKVIVLADEVFASLGRTERVTKAKLEDLAHEHPRLMQYLRGLDLPRGFKIGHLHVMFDEEYEGTLSEDEFINGMFRLFFNNDFGRY